jgi:hypothetical protein
MPLVTVHRFTVGDVEDPDIYAAEPILQWQKSESGAWVMQHSRDTMFSRDTMNTPFWGYNFKIVADLDDPDAVYYTLRWGE